MTHKPAPLITFLETLENVRRAVSCQHSFIDILVIAVCAIIANADTWEDMEEFGDEKEEWLRTFLELPNGIPSHDTFYRTFWRSKVIRKIWKKISGITLKRTGKIILRIPRLTVFMRKAIVVMGEKNIGAAGRLLTLRPSEIMRPGMA